MQVFNTSEKNNYSYTIHQVRKYSNILKHASSYATKRKNAYEYISGFATYIHAVILLPLHPASLMHKNP